MGAFQVMLHDQQEHQLVELQNLFNRDVDLVSQKNLKPSLKPFINKQLITLYGEK